MQNELMLSPAFLHRAGSATAARLLRSLVLPLVWLCLCCNPARSATAPPTAPVPDTIAQRVAACAACHGKEGRAASEGYLPRIAGKPAGYLFNQLLNFRDGRRHNAAMINLVDPLSDAYLLEIATYFASLDLPYAAMQTIPLPDSVKARGEALALRGDPAKRVPACVDCHGAKLTGLQPAAPGLLGLPRDYVLGQLGAWRTGERRAMAPDCMAQVAERLSPEDVGAVAAWLSVQAVPPDSKPVNRRGEPPSVAAAGLRCGSAPK